MKHLKQLVWGYLFVAMTVGGAAHGETLNEAIQQQNQSLIQDIISKKTDLNERDAHGRTALILAAGLGDVQTVKKLLKAGAKVNIKGNNQWTALMHATYGGKLEMVQVLLNAGADLSIRNDIEAPSLMIAAFRGHADVLKLFISKKADVNVQKSDRGTALIWAAFQGHQNIVALLLEAGADIDAVNDKGQSALIMAREQGKMDVETLLLKAKARDGTRVFYSSLDFDTTLGRLKASIAAHKMGIVAEACADCGANKIGVKIAKNRVVMIYHPRFAVRMLKASIAAGVEAPLRIYVTEQTKGTQISYQMPSKTFAPYGVADLDEMAGELDLILKAIVGDTLK